jgi:hypothetical protein
MTGLNYALGTHGLDLNKKPYCRDPVAVYNGFETGAFLDGLKGS